MSLYGDGIPGIYTYADSYRARLGSGDIDLDFCVPSTTLLAYMMKHMLVFEPRDDNSVWLLKGAPRRFYSPNAPAVTVTDAVTRFGTISYQLNISESAGFSTTLKWSLTGRGYVIADAKAASGGSGGSKLQVVLRLRDYSGSTRSARNPRVLSGGCAVAGQDNGGSPETVVVTLSATSQGVAGKGECIITAALAE